jgi:hypothetical protein
MPFVASSIEYLPAQMVAYNKKCLWFLYYYFQFPIEFKSPFSSLYALGINLYVLDALIAYEAMLTIITVYLIIDIKLRIHPAATVF